MSNPNEGNAFMGDVCFLHAPKLLDRLKMSLTYKTTERLGAQGTLSGSQHFRKVEGRVGAPGWD